MSDSELTTPPSGPSTETAFLLAYLREHDAVCPLCKYNLRGLTVPRCPECGKEIKLTVGVSEPYLLPWILTTIFVAMAAGVGILFCVIIVPEIIQFGISSLRVRPREIALIVAIGYGILVIPVTLLLIAMRRRFWRMKRSTQIAFALTAFFVDLGFLVAIVLSKP